MLRHTRKPLGFLEMISKRFFRLKRMRYEKRKDVISYHRFLLFLPALHGVECLLIEIKIGLRIVNF